MKKKKIKNPLTRFVRFFIISSTIGVFKYTVQVLSIIYTIYEYSINTFSVKKKKVRKWTRYVK